MPKRSNKRVWILPGLKNGGFTLPEMLIAAVVLAVVAAIALPIYWDTIEKSRQAEALLNIDAIRKAEYAIYHVNGTYINAGTTDEINGLFALGIQEHFFKYEVVDASESDFKIIATRLGSLAMRIAPVMITAGADGKITTSQAPIPVAPHSNSGSGGSGSGDGDSGGPAGAGGTTGGSGGGVPNDFIGLLTIPGSGSFSPAELSFIPRGPDVYTNWPDVNSLNIQGDPLDVAKLTAAFDLVAASSLSSITDDLKRKGLKIFAGPSDDFTGSTANDIAFFRFGFPDVNGNIFMSPPPDEPNPAVYMEFNPAYMGEDAGLLADVLIHEGTHFGEYLDGTTVNYATGLVSQTDVEFRSFWNQSFYWKSVRENYAPFTTPLAQSNEVYYQHAIRGEADLKAFITSVYSGSG